ncbi:ABC transporter permease [Jiangella ureilytica]|nr:ABC transporter permease [Jiangella ureilytica]
MVLLIADPELGDDDVTERRRARRATWPYVLRRLAMAPLILLGVSLAMFIMVDLSPNDPVTARLGMLADAEARRQFAAEHGLDDPLPLRFWHFLVDLVHLDLGDAIVRSEPVSTLIGQALPVTVELIGLSLLISLPVAALLGTAAAWKEGRATDRVISTLAAFAQATPGFWAGLVFIQVFAVSLGVLPSGGYVPLSMGFTAWLTSMIGPALVLAMGFAAALTRIVRASMADELAKDYVRTTIGAGVSWPVALGQSVFRNALLAPLTVVGIFVGAMMSVAILVEVVFNLPGLGTLLVTGINQGDLAVVRGAALVGATAFVTVNLVVDLLYLVLAPQSAEAGTS